MAWEATIDPFTQALRRLGSGSGVVTQTCWVAEESPPALHTCFTNADLTDPMYAEPMDAFKTLVVGNTYNGLGSLNFLFSHCDLKILSAAVGTLSSFCDREM